MIRKSGNHFWDKIVFKLLILREFVLASLSLPVEARFSLLQ